MSTRKKRTFHDAQFGDVVLDFKYDNGTVGYKASFPFLSRKSTEFGFYARSESDGDLKHVLDIGHDLLTRESVVGASLSRYIRKSVLKSLNAIDSFRSRKIGEEDLEKSLRLEGVDIYYDGDVRVFYEPQQTLQFDHGLQIYMNSKGKIRDHEFIG